MVELGHHTLAKSPFIVGPQDIVALLPETNFELLRLKQTINACFPHISSRDFMCLGLRGMSEHGVYMGIRYTPQNSH